MRNVCSLATGAIVALFLAFAQSAPSAGQGPLAFTHVTVIDTGGGPVLRDHTVIVVGDRIQAVGKSPSVKIPDGATVVNAAGKYLIPGLWDAHVHTRYEGIPFLSLFLLNGVTAVRDTAGPWAHFDRIQKWRDDIAAGRLAGPRLIPAGPLIDGPNSRWTHGLMAASPDEGRRAVQDVKVRGASFVKVYDLLGRDTFFAIVDEAKRAGLPFAGHVPLSISAREASAAGQRTIEHLAGVLLACSTREDELRRDLTLGRSVSDSILLETFSDAKAAALIGSFVKNRTAQVPTLSLTWTRLAVLHKDPELVAGRRLTYIPESYQRQWNGNVRPLDAAARATMSRVYAKYKTLVVEMRRAGVEFLAGTDTLKPYLIPGFSLQDELRIMVEAGFSPLEALQAATRNPARVVGVEGLGTITPGCLADLVLLDGDPLDDIRNTGAIRAVVAAGRLFDRSALDSLARQAADSAAAWKGSPTGR